ncbi:MAG: glycine-rich domain-containing protein [Phycisphaerales bacterium]
MNDRMRQVWEKLEAFEIDEGRPDLPFAVRLARENGWRVPYATRVVEEYKRFLLLAAEAGHKVTPSDEVDQAWHLHMTYTRSYWQRLCEGVLGKPMHHDPTRGGEQEDAKFDNWYQRTLDSYRKAFGASAPADIWPPAAVRFDSAQRWVRIDASRAWMVPKRSARRAAATATVGALVVGGAALVGCSPSLVGSSAGWGTALLIIVVVVVVIAILGSLANEARGGRRTSGSGCSGGCSSFLGFGCSSSDPDGHTGGHSGDHGGGDSGGGHSGGDSGGGGGGDGGGSSGCGGGGCGGGGCGGGGD